MFYQSLCFLAEEGFLLTEYFISQICPFCTIKVRINMASHVITQHENVLKISFEVVLGEWVASWL